MVGGLMVVRTVNQGFGRRTRYVTQSRLKIPYLRSEEYEQGSA